MRLILHTAAYWLMLNVRDVIPKAHALAAAEFTTIRLRLLKLGARVIETAARVRLAFAAACPEATLFRHIAAGPLSPRPPPLANPQRLPNRSDPAAIQTPPSNSSLPQRQVYWRPSTRVVN